MQPVPNPVVPIRPTRGLTRNGSRRCPKMETPPSQQHAVGTRPPAVHPGSPSTGAYYGRESAVAAASFSGELMRPRVSAIAALLNGAPWRNMGRALLRHTSLRRTSNVAWQKTVAPNTATARSTAAIAPSHLTKLGSPAVSVVGTGASAQSDPARDPDRGRTIGHGSTLPDPAIPSISQEPLNHPATRPARMASTYSRRGVAVTRQAAGAPRERAASPDPQAATKSASGRTATSAGTGVSNTSARAATKSANLWQMRRTVTPKTTGPRAAHNDCLTSIPPDCVSQSLLFSSSPLTNWDNRPHSGITTFPHASSLCPSIPHECTIS